MAEANSRGWVGQLAGAVVLALVAGGASPWWWSELKRAWQPDAPPTVTSAPAATSAPVAPASAASTASVTTSNLATETSAPAPRSESAAIRPRPEATDQTSQRPATVRPAARPTPATAPVEPASGSQRRCNPIRRRIARSNGSMKGRRVSATAPPSPTASGTFSGTPEVSVPFPTSSGRP
jgi:cytoskeletal protein RodZ